MHITKVFLELPHVRRRSPKHGSSKVATESSYVGRHQAG